jgi:dihydrofolate reductase
MRLDANGIRLFVQSIIGEHAMGKVVIDITMSLDGFVTGPNDGPNNGLGDNGRILHEWALNPSEDDMKLLVEEPMQTIGSGILGRRTFDIAEEAWGENPPFGPGNIYVLTHRAHEPLQRGPTTFVFITEGMDKALELAQADAGDLNVNLMGADVSQQYLKAGLVDELEIHVANVILGAGRPLFAHIGDDQIRLDRIRVIPTPAATHLRYQVVR